MKEELKEIKNISVAQDDRVPMRIARFLNEIGNPYRFRVNGVPVRLSFAERASAPSAEDVLVKIVTARMR